MFFAAKASFGFATTPAQRQECVKSSLGKILFLLGLIFLVAALPPGELLTTFLRINRTGSFNHARGFTLLELLVVMVIIGLLVGYVGPRYFSQIGKSEVKAARAQLNALEKALEQYRIDTGKVPSTDQGLNALFVKPPSESRWQGPYLKKLHPLDPWGNAYTYRATNAEGDFEIMSLGKDGSPGGEGEAADISP